MVNKKNNLKIIKEILPLIETFKIVNTLIR